MARKRRRPHSPNRALTMAGWLFADLMLVLFVVGLGSQPTTFAEPSSASASPSPSPTPTPTPTQPPGLAKESVMLSIEVNNSRLMSSGSTRQSEVDNFRAQVNQALQDKGLNNAEAGLVLIWAYAPDVGKGMDIAEAVAAELPQSNPAVMGNTAIKELWHGGAQPRVDLEVYILNH